jgi:small subunit ribosomal protein S17
MVILMAKAKTGEPTKTSVKKSDDEEKEKKIGKKLQHARDIEKTQSRRKIKVVKKVVKKKVKKKAVEVAKVARDIGIDVVPPDSSCDDAICPFHGTLPVRGRIIEGVVVRDKMDKSIVVKRELIRYIPKYERYEKRTRTYTAYNPLCINALVGEKVKIMECRPISKTKSFVVIESSR